MHTNRSLPYKQQITCASPSLVSFHVVALNHFRLDTRACMCVCACFGMLSEKKDVGVTIANFQTKLLSTFASAVTYFMDTLYITACLSYIHHHILEWF